MSSTASSNSEVRAAFARIVNMTPREIDDWHKTEQSKSVDGDSVKAGQRTMQLLRIKRAPNADDIAHMRRVIDFVDRMLNDGPSENRETSRWRYALMNWGHDPLKVTDADKPWR
jgi:hypothetical protein